MQARLFLSSLVLLVLSATSASYAAKGCGDLTLCVKNPPNPPEPPLCTTYRNFCSFVPPLLEMTPPKEPKEMAPLKEVIPEGLQEAPAGPGYSITLNNLSKEQMNKILDQLGVDTSKVKAPQ